MASGRMLELGRAYIGEHIKVNPSKNETHKRNKVFSLLFYPIFMNRNRR